MEIFGVGVVYGRSDFNRSGLGFRKNMLQLLMGNELVLPEAIWSKMAWLWGGFFIGLGCLNWWIFTHYNYDVWMNFKTFWAFGLMVVL